MRLSIKNMVCRHCADTVRRVFDNLGIPDVEVELGRAYIPVELSADCLDKVSEALCEEGFEIIQSREAEIVETVKHTLIELARMESDSKPTIADALTSRIPLSYQQISRTFTEVEGRTIENYYLNIRIERVKELIRYRRLSLSEIAHETGFSSVAHLSRQFKQLTGLTPSQFKDMGERRPLSEV
ncbi:MAG: helix-turn-helix domain-containing protein [Duncaniella sp.]|nr:helix-turn-helix domain-containing protein [Duncaniella sp.]